MTAFSAFVLLAMPALAQQSNAVAPNPRVVSPCVAPDPSHCARVAERLRLDHRAMRPLQPIGPPNAFAPLPPGDAMMPAQLRVQGGFGGPGPARR